MRRKRNLYKSKHPFNEYPFEAFYCGSWQPVERIRIMEGIVTMHLTESRTLVEEKRPFTNIRVRSRKATLPDCTCFLRPGIDVCVLTTPEKEEGSDENDPEPVLADAKLSSVERKPHDNRCSCQFYVRFYVDQGPLGSEKGTLSKDTKVVGIDEITILQRLEKSPCDNQSYRWNFSEDCSSLQKTKLLLGRFSSDLSWLVAASVLKQTAFDVISVDSRIVYQILNDDDDENPSSNSADNLNAINFKDDDGITTSHVFQFIPSATETKEKSPPRDKQEAGTLPFYEVMNLRRSKRRMVQPDRFLGCDIPPGTEVGWVRMFPIKTDKGNEGDDDLELPLQYLLSGHENVSEEYTEGGIRNPVERKRKSKHREIEGGPANRKERVPELAIVPVSAENEPIAFYQNHIPPMLIGNGSGEKDEKPTKKSKSKAGRRPILRKKASPEIEDDMEFQSRWEDETPDKKVQSKKIYEEEDMEIESKMCWGRSYSKNKKVQRNRYRSFNTKVGDCSEKMVYKRPTLSDGAYNRLINSYMKNIDSTVTDDETSIIDQWNQFKAKNSRNQKTEVVQSSSEDEEELSETEMLWREMELAMASAYILDGDEDSLAGASVETPAKSHTGCQHDYKLDEEVGIQCRLCGFVSTEIKYVTAPFLHQKSWTADNRTENNEGLWDKPDAEDCLNLDRDEDLSKTSLQDENENVWALVPNFKMKLHFHQKKAFEFLWKTIAGSMIPIEMQPSSKNTGGCVISHTPGAGKTFLIIAFLASYLKLFPGKRPLVLAPKTTLYTWYKEFIKWQVPIPVHLIHGRRTYNGIFKPKNVRQFHGVPRPNNDVMHVLDCLEKIQKWHAQPSVLVMGYTSFLTLMREDSKFAHRKYMAKVLRESPGILILDEGHNPRSTKSRLRKVLMKVETDLRILLSGTLFQNNFCEYFNTLSLARPKFINEVLMSLDPKFKRKKNLRKKARHLLESRARKFFLDTIAKKIDSDVNEERMEGLNMLRNLTSGFIDVYEGGGGSDTLPGLQIYTLLMNSTNIQHEVLGKLHQIMATYNGYPLELELLITLASIHPWLVKTSNCATKFFSMEELMDLDRIKFNIQKGSKVHFVLNLVQRVVRKEKVLIFCHNIAPITLFVELFERIFRWRKGREILVLTGDQELFERGRIMDKFEEPGGSSRVLLASITACAEGISLTSASRVVMLDSEWNPSKTKQAIARAFRPGQQKVVYVYQLLAAGTLEEAKYRRTTWKEWVSCMIFSEAFVEDPSRWQAEKIEDDVLREIVGDDKLKSFHMIMKNEKASTG